MRVHKIKPHMNITHKIKYFSVIIVFFSSPLVFAMKRPLPSMSRLDEGGAFAPADLGEAESPLLDAGAEIQVPRPKRILVTEAGSTIGFKDLGPSGAGGGGQALGTGLVPSSASAFSAVEQLGSLQAPVVADATGFGGGGGGGDLAGGGVGSPPRNLNRVASLAGLRALVTYDYSKISNFQSGDLWYGLQIARESTVSGLRHDPAVSDSVLVVDPLNQFFWVNQKNGPGGAALPAAQEQMDRSEIHRLVGDAVAAGEWKEVDRERLEAYGQEIAERVATSKDDEDFYRRACVFAISFQQKRGQKIHFILDHLTLADVNRPGSEYFDSYTSHELRGVLDLYRMNPAILRTVILYRAGARLDEREAAQVLESL